MATATTATLATSEATKAPTQPVFDYALANVVLDEFSLYAAYIRHYECHAWLARVFAGWRVLGPWTARWAHEARVAAWCQRESVERLIFLLWRRGHHGIAKGLWRELRKNRRDGWTGRKECRNDAR